MKTLVVGDIHNRIDIADRIIEHSATVHQHNNIVFLGDYFDAFDDTTEEIGRAHV